MRILGSTWREQAIEPRRLAIENSADFYRTLLDNLHDGVYFVNLDRMITFWNKGAERLTGYSRTEVAGKYCFDNILEHVDDAGRCVCVEGCPLRNTMDDGIPREVEVYFRHKLGHRVPVSVRASCIRDTLGKIVGAVEVFTDITAKKIVERRTEELEGFAYRDALTGVANRRYAEFKIEQTIDDVKEFDRSAGLMLIDIDNFKCVNDTWGHPAGDQVIRAVSKTLVGAIRPSDTIGRWGGEEFVLILRDTNTVLLKEMAERFRRLVSSNRVEVPGGCVRVTLSVGATQLQPPDTAHSAIKRADELMYRSKALGRNQTNVD